MAQQHPPPPSPAALLEAADEESAFNAVAAAHALVLIDPAAAEAMVRPVIQALHGANANRIAGCAQHVLGLARAYQGDPVGGETHLSLAINTLAQAGARRLEGVARCDRASVHGHHLGLTEEATAGFEHALQIAVEVGSRQDEGRAQSLMGGLYGRLGLLAESERALHRALELLDEKLDAHSHMSACNNLGHLLSQARRFDEAVPILAHGLERLDPAHRSMACTLRCSLALAVAHTGALDRALRLLNDNEAETPSLGAYDKVDHALTRGRVLLLSGRAAEGLSALRMALAEAEQASLSAPAAECLRELALAAEQAGDLRSALDCERRLREVERRLLDASSAARLLARENALQWGAQASQNLVVERSHALLRSVVDADDDLIFAKDERGVFVLANRAFLAYWNLQEADVLGRTSHGVFGSTPLIEASLAADEAVRCTGLPQQIEQTVLTQGGARIVLTRRQAIVSPDGTPWLLGVVRDVTESRQQERVLQRQEAFTREVIDQDTNLIFVKDAQMRYVMANAAFARMFGKHPDELLGRTPSDLSDKSEELERILAADQRVLAQGLPVEQEDVFTVAGELRHFIAVKKPIVTPNGATGILGIARDMTEIRRGEWRLREALRSAEAANEAKSSFLANMSHEIRTPINGIMGMIDLAGRAALERDRQQYLDLARSSADALLTIVNDILDFSKVEAGKMTVEQVPFPIYDLLHDLTRPLALKAAEKQLRLLAQVAADLPLAPIGDPTRLRQVLGNLLGNAIKFTDRGVVTLEVSVLSVRDDAVELRFAVRDTGIGVSEEQQQTVFDAFTQADGSIARRFGGTGLGLAISARLVHLMGGRLALESQLAVGSCFSFELTLPLDATAPGPTRLAKPDTAQRLVIWIEPHAGHRAWCAQQLQHWQVEVHAVGSVGEALEHMARARCDAVFVDSSVLAAQSAAVAELLRHAEPGRVFVMVAAEEVLPLAVAQALGRRGLTLPKPLLPPDVLRALAGSGRDTQGVALDAAGTAPDDDARPFNGLRILLAEDNPVNQMLAVAVVERLGGTLHKAEDGAEALALMQQVAFDLVLMDVQMPRLDGSEAVKRWRAIEAVRVPPQHIPIIAMTAHALTGDRERFLADGFDGYVSKPFRQNDLVSEALRVLSARTMPILGGKVDAIN